MTTTQRCAERIWTGGAFHPQQCSRRAVATEDGKLWCGQHRPSAVIARRNASRERYQQQWELRQRAEAGLFFQRGVGKHVLGALKTIVATICDKPLCGHFTAEEIRAVAEKAIAEAEGK